MVRTLVLSDKLRPDENWLDVVMKGDVNVHEWIEYPNIPRASDYEVVVLDMEIPHENEYGGAFLGLIREIEILLESGGVVICLNHFTKHTNYSTHYNPKKSPLKKSQVISVERYQRREMNYDWVFDDSLLSALNVSQVDAKIGRHFSLISKDKILAEYFKGVTEYHKTIDNIRSRTDEEGNFLGYYVRVPTLGAFDTRIIAVAKVTKKPVACAMNISKGSLIFLPQSEAEPKTVIAQLYVIGKSEYEKNIERIEEYPSPPEWLDKYKTEQELKLEQKIEGLTNELEQRRLKHKRFEKIDVLLYGTGTPLETAVQRALEEMGCTVEKMEKGATIDLKAKIDSMKFAIEITGVDDKIYKNSKKFGQILQYLPIKEENEKIVLLANTYKDEDVRERLGRENFTKPVLDIAKNNEFCFTRTMDLYFMWKDFLMGKSAKKMLQAVFSAKGELRHVVSL